MLRMHCVQLWYDLSDPGMEDLLYEVESVRRFAGLRLSGPMPVETTILKFRHLLEARGLGEGLFQAIIAHLADEGGRSGGIRRRRNRAWGYLVQCTARHFHWFEAEIPPAELEAAKRCFGLVEGRGGADRGPRFRVVRRRVIDPDGWSRRADARGRSTASWWAWHARG